MPMFKNKWFLEDELVQELRNKFLDDLPTEKQNYHEDDIKRVKENDFFVARYILHNEKDIEKSYNMLTESLKYRKEMEVNTLRKKDLPKEYFDNRAVILCNKDNRDHPIVAIRCKTHVNNKDTRRQQQQYMLYWVERGLRQSDWGAVTILFDCTDSGVSNVDLDMMRFIFSTFNKYVPWGLGYFFVYNMPWYLSALWKVIKQWVPQRHLEKIKFVDCNSILEFVDVDQLPICLGGTSSKLYEPKNGVSRDGDESE
ncbi:hypothetical protein JTE90_005866 [Oedothorax gibbosus]|uniref:CRAL-TRIO domain-containing protein n=1 Tax=Oedothorax gibbosus TaxID=931172 RepID=A0AAV6UQD8_9ARAC|nr:hypothetical protein JTE90_005866 [Oedothorax gibbosus]